MYYFSIHVHVAPTAEQIENDRGRNEEAGQEEMCMDNPTPDPEDPENFHCVEACPDRGNHSAVQEGKNTCFGKSNLHVLVFIICDSITSLSLSLSLAPLPLFQPVV